MKYRCASSTAMRWLPLLFVMTAFAGCASDAPAGDPEVPEDPAVELEDALAAYRAGNETSNLALVGEYDNTGEEADAWQDYVFVDAGSTVRILQQIGVNGTWELAEVAAIPGTGPKDVKVSDDGEWLFIGNDEQGSNTPVAPTGRAGGFYTYFIGDKANPEQTQFLPVGPLRGPHMVFYHQQADGTELVLGANADISINRFDRDTGALTEASRYAPDYVIDVNRDPMVVDAYYQLYAHDMFVMEDNSSGQDQTLMYVANWDAGLRVVDVTDPDSPQELGSWNDFPDGHSGNLHTVATEWIGDRRITVGSVEVGFAVVGGIPYATDTEQTPVYIWDTTDPSDIRLIGQWVNPDGLTAGRQDLGETLYSPHNFQLEGGIIYIAHYALGVFAIDIRTPELQAAPEMIGYYKAGHTWDVIIAQGAVIGSGGYGLVGMEFPVLERGPAGLFSRA